MLRTLLLMIYLFGSYRGGTRAVNNFDDVRQDFEFIFHELNDLLLTIHGNACYFTHIENPDNNFVWDNEAVEMQVMMLVLQPDDHVQLTSLSEVRNEFMDLMADFMCQNKTIYIITLPELGHYGDHCVWDFQCSQARMECQNSTCVCMSGLRINQNETDCILDYTYGQSCTGNDDCAMPNTQCWFNHCECVFFYHYDSTNNVCVENMK